MMKKNKNTIPILEKSLDVMEYIAASETPVRLPELQENLGIAQASCYRIVATLVHRGWLEKYSGNRYEIAAGMARVADKTRFRLEKYKHLQQHGIQLLRLCLLQVLHMSLLTMPGKRTQMQQRVKLRKRHQVRGHLL